MPIAVASRAKGADQQSAQTTVAMVLTTISPLLIGVAWIDGSNVDTVYWGAQLARKLSQVVSVAGGWSVALWIVTAPIVASANVIVNFGGTTRNCVACVATSGGEFSADPWRTIYTRTDADGTGPGLTVTDGEAGDLLVHVAAIVGFAIVFDAPEITTTTQQDNIFGAGASGGMGTKIATAAGQTVGCTDAATYAEIGVAIREDHQPSKRVGSAAQTAPTSRDRGNIPQRSQ